MALLNNQPTKLTIARAKDIVRVLGFTLKKNSWGEYVLRGDSQEYFASDLNDAVTTAYYIDRMRTNPLDDVALIA